MGRVCAVIFAALMGGCAYTEVSLPLRDGQMAHYRSTRDTEVQDLFVEIKPDGTTTIELGQGVGGASAVVEAYTPIFGAALQAALQAVERAAVP